MMLAVLVCALIPALLIAVNWRVFERPAPAEAPPPISVLIPARNEAANIGAACAAVLASRGVELELVVLDDHSRDDTAAIVRAIADPRVRLEHAPDLPPGWVGKQHACWVLARHARHALLVFVDADVRLAPDALTRIAGFMQREDVQLASGFPRELTGSWGEALLVPLIHYLLLGFLPMPVARRSTQPSLGAGCGQLMAASAPAYWRVGGHAAIRGSLHDGITLPRAFRAAGCMTGLFDASDLATCRMFHSLPETLRGLARNATEGMATPIGLPVWTTLLGLGQIAPLVLAILAPGAASAALLGLAVVPRLAIGLRFRQPLWSAVLHPVGIAALLALQWWAFARSCLGVRPQWRGRAYAPR